MYLLTCTPNEYSNHPAHLRFLIRVFVVRMNKIYILDNPKCAQGRFWSACAYAQADLNLRLAHMSKDTTHIGFFQGYIREKLSAASPDSNIVKCLRCSKYKMHKTRLRGTNTLSRETTLSKLLDPLQYPKPTSEKESTQETKQKLPF